eukprot:CAMPEP_0179956048 /NCGR_PEP_ID=MMETSP0983-20121128/26672_1 /TAXON_ID=483367 /ORGANISM="non described non described, Strain CCMP 2436" /LENGTH=52 /DNA_ID=CAMNT_0021867851 /DNA_START=178 /DNA_END=332 /DNA_ORIENTATION=-
MTRGRHTGWGWSRAQAGVLGGSRDNVPLLLLRLEPLALAPVLVAVVFSAGRL